MQRIQFLICFAFFFILLRVLLRYCSFPFMFAPSFRVFPICAIEQTFILFFVQYSISFVLCRPSEILLPSVTLGCWSAIIICESPKRISDVFLPSFVASSSRFCHLLFFSGLSEKACNAIRTKMRKENSFYIPFVAVEQSSFIWWSSDNLNWHD